MVNIYHLLMLIPYLICFLIFIFIWRKALMALMVVGFSMALVLQAFLNNWEWFFYPVIVTIGILSLYGFIKLGFEGELY